MKLLIIFALFLCACGGTKPPVVGPTNPGPHNPPAVNNPNSIEPVDAASDGASDAASEAVSKYPPGLEHLETIDSSTEQIAAIQEFLNTIGYDWHSFIDKPGQLADRACRFAENFATISAACALLKELNADEECLDVDGQLNDILELFTKRSKVAIKNRHLKMISGHKPYENLEVTVTWQQEDGSSLAWQGANVVFDAPQGLLNQEEWQSDSNGHIVNEFEQVAMGGQAIRVSLAPFSCQILADRWLPPFANITLHELKSETAHIEIFFYEEVRQDPAIHQLFTETLLGELFRLGLKGARTLREYDSLMLKSYRNPDEALAYLQAREKKGDILIFGTVNSDFISRVGARSMWHEAVANFKIIDEANNAEIYSGSLSGRATGIGEQDAADNAMSALAKSIAEDPVMAAIKNYLIK